MMAVIMLNFGDLGIHRNWGILKHLGILKMCDWGKWMNMNFGSCFLNWVRPVGYRSKSFCVFFYYCATFGMSRVNKFPSNHSFNLWGVSHHNDHKFPSDLVKKSSRPHHPRPFWPPILKGSFLVSGNPEMGPTTGDKKSGKSVHPRFRLFRITSKSRINDQVDNHFSWLAITADGTKIPLKSTRLRLLLYLIFYEFF